MCLEPGPEFPSYAPAPCTAAVPHLQFHVSWGPAQLGPRLSSVPATHLGGLACALGLPSGQVRPLWTRHTALSLLPWPCPLAHLCLLQPASQGPKGSEGPCQSLWAGQGWWGQVSALPNPVPALLLAWLVVLSRPGLARVLPGPRGAHEGWRVRGGGQSLREGLPEEAGGDRGQAVAGELGRAAHRPGGVGCEFMPPALS